GGAAAAAIGAAVMLNARYVPISISVASWFEGPAPKRLLEAQLIVDESWAVALKRKGGFDVRVLLGAGGLLYLTWNSGTARRRLPRRLEPESSVSTVWLCVIGVGVATVAFKATGPVLVGRRQLPAWLARPVALLAPAVLAALVVTQAVGGHREIVADARLAGL